MDAGEAERNLILGIAEDLAWDHLRPFVESLRQTFAGEVRLFTAGLDRETEERLLAAGIQLDRVRRVRLERNGRVFHPYDPPLRRLRSDRIARAYAPLIRGLTIAARDRARARATLAAPISVPHVARFFRAYRYLSRAAHRHASVMLTDVRDVFFQRDPFDFDIGGRVHCFLEYEGETLGSQHHNRDWLIAAYGEEVLRRLGPKPISCSGVTIGAAPAVLAYLRAMVDELVRLRKQGFGIDQAVHNVVVHSGRVPDLELVENGTGPVLTLALVPKEDVTSALPGGFADVNVLHQYDRHPGLAEELLRGLDARVAARAGGARRRRTSSR